MSEPHPYLGVWHGEKLYGIKTISVLAPRMEAVLDDCEAAARSSDARDKYFAVSVPAFDPLAGTALEQEVTALEAAAASLGVTLSEISVALPKLATCLASGTN